MADDKPTPDLLARTASNPWTDLGLTLPIFVAYHLGVVVLPVRNAADWATRQLVQLAENDLTMYSLLTLAIAAGYVGVLCAAGRGQALDWSRFLGLALEGVLYAVVMRLVASYVAGRVTLGPGIDSTFGGVVLSCGAGFYEEVAFRVGLFGLGLRAIHVLFPLGATQKVLVWLTWGLATSLFFSLWHYIGPYGESLELKSFVFRWVCGMVFTVIYAFRGFAPAVWTHTLYDAWILVL